jgi:hypothetical protein
MQDNLATIAKAFRHNSGKHFLDSGDFYGRHYDKPPITKDTPLVTIGTWGNDEVTATIETARFLAETCDVDFDIQKQFEEWAALEENSELSWFEAGEQFATEVLGLQQLARDNTYNGENDLSQDYVWEVYSENDKGDWIYDGDAIMVVYAHTGCDVRGGYAYPLFLRCKGDYAIPVDLCAEFYISEGRLNGEELDDDTCRELDEKWMLGYSSLPSYEFSKNIERVFGFTKTQDSVVVKLKSGEIVKVYASTRTDY